MPFGETSLAVRVRAVPPLTSYPDGVSTMVVGLVSCDARVLVGAHIHDRISLPGRILDAGISIEILGE